MINHFHGSIDDSEHRINWKLVVKLLHKISYHEQMFIQCMFVLTLALGCNSSKATYSTFTL